MRSATYHLELPAADIHPSIHSVILYEDFSSGIRGKIFSELVAEELAPNCRSVSSLWRLDVIDSPSISEKIIAEFGNADMLILSLRGDRALYPSIQRWLSAHVRSLPESERHVVLLADEATYEESVFITLQEQLAHICTGTKATVSAYVSDTSKDADSVNFRADWPKEQLSSN